MGYRVKQITTMVLKNCNTYKLYKKGIVIDTDSFQNGYKFEVKSFRKRLGKEWVLNHSIKGWTRCGYSRTITGEQQ